MPSSLNIGGKRIFRPSIQASVDVSALGGRGVSTGNVAMVGAFPSFPAKTPTEFASARQVAAFDPTDADLALRASLAFSPSLDRRVPGGADRLFVLNVQPNTQAQATFADTDGADALVVKSKVWGSRGNRSRVTISTHEAGKLGIDVKVVANGVTEEYEDLQSGPIAQLTYDGAGLDRATAEISPSSVQLRWEADMPAFAGDASNSDPGVSLAAATLSEALSANAALTFVVDEADHQQDIKFYVSGLDHEGNEVDPTAEGITAIAVGDNTATSDVLWSRIDSITAACTDQAFTGTPTVKGVAFDLDPSEFNSAAEILGVINQAAALGWRATLVHPRAGSIPADELDAVAAGTSIKAVNVALRADLWAMVQGLAPSRLVSASRAAAATKPPAPAGADPVGSVTSELRGGGETAPITTQHWTDALLALVAEDVQIVHAASDDVAHHKAVVEHCRMAALYGSERNAWLGAAASKTLAEVDAEYTAALNTEHAAVVGQRVVVDAPDGRRLTLDPEYFALMCAGMQAGSPVATPLTEKRPNVVDVVSGWSPVLDDDRVIQAGICALTRDRLGWKVLRSVTTYRTDDNPVLSEVSAWESINTSVRRLRAQLLGRIGERVLGLTRGLLEGLVEAELRQQVRDAVIKAFQSIVVIDGGDAFEIGYEVAPIEPLNFILIKPSAIRIPGA